jgi:hypothetical protein
LDVDFGKLRVACGEHKTFSKLEVETTTDVEGRSEDDRACCDRSFSEDSD